MLSDALGESVLLLPASDLHTVTLRVLPGSDAANLTTDAIVSMCSAREITTRAIDRDAIDALIQRANEQHAAAQDEHGEGDSEERPLEAIIARGTPPTHGTNGRFELDPHLAQQLERIKAAKASDATARSDDAVNPDSSDTNDAAVDHYNTSAFVIVDRETVIGRLTPPTEGEDGTDIHGDIIPAQPGRRATLDEHPSITVRRDGTIIANKHGRLVVRPGIVRVDHELVIRGNVDFSTGNIRFPGDVTITEGVKDRFRIESERSVRVLRLVEAAFIHADLDAVLETGAAGRERGEIHAARDIHAGYLDAVAIHAGRDCTVEREITNCTADVGRNLVVSNGILRAGGLSLRLRLRRRHHRGPGWCGDRDRTGSTRSAVRDGPQTRQRRAGHRNPGRRSRGGTEKLSARHQTDGVAGRGPLRARIPCFQRPSPAPTRRRSPRKAQGGAPISAAAVADLQKGHRSGHHHPFRPVSTQSSRRGQRPAPTRLAPKRATDGPRDSNRDGHAPSNRSSSWHSTRTRLTYASPKASLSPRASCIKTSRPPDGSHPRHHSPRHRSTAAMPNTPSA
jgi:hypothetical protein